MKTIAEQISNRCVHFTGVHREQCAAGVEYAEFKTRLPCLKSFGGEKIACMLRHWPTEAEIAKGVAEHEAAVAKIAHVLPIIAKVKREHFKENWHGTDTCPVCGGTLHLRIAKINGHVWGRCETADCLSWME